MSVNIATLVDLGFTVADGEHVKMSFDSEVLSVVFRNWKDEEVRFFCHDTLAFRWQGAEYFISKQERFDSVHEIINSDWLLTHQEQSQTWPGTTFHHYKMNFNGTGIFEVLCSKVSKT